MLRDRCHQLSAEARSVVVRSAPLDAPQAFHSLVCLGYQILAGAPPVQLHLRYHGAKTRQLQVRGCVSVEQKPHRMFVAAQIGSKHEAGVAIAQHLHDIREFVSMKRQFEPEMPAFAANSAH
jgi:hypothetical protein